MVSLEEGEGRAIPDGVGTGQCKILSGVSGTGFYS